MDTEQRRTAVEDLVALRRPVDQAVQRLRQFPWDSDEELAVLGPAELHATLNKFLNSDISAEELELWANSVEGRDDIQFKPREIIDLIAEISNPSLFSPITVQSMRDLQARLDRL